MILEDKLTKKIGLIGGLSYPSTITYYERINKLVNQRLGKAHSARIILESLDFQPMAEWLTQHNHAAATYALVTAAFRLEFGGADVIAMCCNTVHKYAEQVAASIEAPLINICTCTAEEAARRGSKTVALLGSAYSMEENFYRDEFERHGIRVLVPDVEERRFMQQAIESELSVGAVSAETRNRFIQIAQTLFARGADTLVLACTEIPLVIRQQDVAFPIIDTVDVHCAAIVSRVLKVEPAKSKEDACEVLI